VERLKHFCARDAFDIEGLGERNLETFFREGLVQTAPDIFTLAARDRASLTPLRCKEGWQEKSVANLFAAIDKARTQPLSRVIYALGIPPYRAGNGKAAGTALWVDGKRCRLQQKLQRMRHPMRGRN